MRRGKYPWVLLQKPGDYFVVPYELRDYGFVKWSMVQQKNWKYRGLYRYEAWDMTRDRESWVVLIQLVDLVQDVYLEDRCPRWWVDGWRIEGLGPLV